MKKVTLFTFRCLLLMLNYSSKTVLAILVALVFLAQMQNAAKADEIGLDFSVPEVTELATIPMDREIETPKQEASYSISAERAPPVKTAFAPLEVAAPYFIDDSPPGSYDFTLLRNNRDDVEIPSPCTGTVTYLKYSQQGYGNRVEVLCEESGYAYFMAHLDSIVVRVGDRVTQGQPLGVQGTTGRSTGPHVHLEIGTRPYLEFYPENRILNREQTTPLVYAYFEMVSNPPVISPPAPPLVEPVPVEVAQPAVVPTVDAVELDFSVPATRPVTDDMALEFDAAIAPVAAPLVEPPPETPEVGKGGVVESAVDTSLVPQAWWEQASDSPLAIAIGAAEGTRQADGTKNPAYYWHVDPGNGADNFGTFSYQHLPSEDTYSVASVSSSQLKREIAAEMKLPEKADSLQLQRLKGFHDQLVEQAKAKGLELNQTELVNGLDLSNQSPAAGLYAGGYIDRLVQMKQLVNDPNEQVLEARVWSYWDMNRNTWDAPGLGNTYPSIRDDQQRRMEQVNLALKLQTESVQHLASS